MSAVTDALNVAALAWVELNPGRAQELAEDYTSRGNLFLDEAEAVFFPAIAHLKPPPPPPTTKRDKVGIPESLRWEIWERDDFTCQYCGTRRHLTIDHILAESKGGTLDSDNLQTLCRNCNSRKGAR